MPTPTYTPIASQTLSSSATSVTFSSIPGTYRDLILVCGNINSNTSTTPVGIRFNSDTGANYSQVIMYGTGSTAASAIENTSQIYVLYASNIGTTANANIIIQVMDYTESKHKSVLARGNSSSQFTEAHAGRWANTNAITSFTVLTNANGFASGSTFSLYGVIA